MSYINEKIKEQFPDLAVMKNETNRSLFAGRTTLPSFVKDYILRRFSDENGVADREKVSEYLSEKMPDRLEDITKNLLAGEQVNITVRIIVKADISSGRTTFAIPDAGIDRNAFISQKLLDESGDDLTDGEHWGNITLNYVTPQGRRSGYIEMVTYKSFEPYKIDYSYFYEAREHFSITEWIDALIATMEYNPDTFETEEQKLEFISRLLILVEPRLNIIELGPKGTGKSYVYNNISKYAWLHSGGRTTRAKLFYNKATKQFGLMKNHDALIIDEISTFTFSEPDEMQSILKGYLESGQATVDNVLFLSECGVGLSGNIALTSEMVPSDSRYFEKLPDMFRESATMDRFHGFIEGWKLPRLEVGSIGEGWTLNAEYFSGVLHNLRKVSDYEALFNELVAYDEATDLRDLKAVRKLATAYAKLLFPHVHKLEDLADEDVDQYRQLYQKYCLEPAVHRRAIIREQCHYIDPEYHKEMPEFTMK
ncbi:MAG: BREX system Lon protease-like protein BrxL [Prevotella sp.]|nr:BREX system Lon protease-like protein BrxL [Prevotella sp.]